MKYSYRVRLAIVKRVKQGEAISHLSKAYSVSCNKIREWVQMWDKYGCSGLKYQPHSRPTRALKEKIVRLILERGVPLTQVRIEYRICRTTLYCCGSIQYVSMVMMVLNRQNAWDDLPKR